MKKLKAVIHTVSTLPDTYGNRYHFATVLNVKTGAELTFITDTENNISLEVTKILGAGYPSECLKVYHSDIKRKEYNFLTKKMPYQHSINLKAHLLLGGR